ncbi:MAG: protein translocase subunit SecF [Candidatus Pacebacteria bacterium]|nr:protein translocase subunit SecF [Candidatus Paceibacterota bacterium]MBP9780861.1 protein translocase subunit SecF [Candidatus Paceibacterota bacterium]
MFIIRNRKIFLGISAVFVLASITMLVVFGLKPGIEFKGGALAEVVYPDARPEQSKITEGIEKSSIKSALVQPAGENGFIVKTHSLTESERKELMNILSLNGTVKVEEKNFTTIGPSVGKELARKSIVSIVLVILVIVSFIAYAFRKVSEPVSSWKYGVIAMVALVHDVVISAGVFALVSHVFGAEMDTLFVVALLTVLGLSISDTIVVFDRIRENLAFNNNNKIIEKFENTVGKSISQTFTRSINTSLTVILVLLALLIFGPETTRYFALILTVGMFFGTYSSIFLASPLLVAIEQKSDKNK